LWAYLHMKELHGAYIIERRAPTQSYLERVRTRIALLKRDYCRGGGASPMTDIGDSVVAPQRKTSTGMQLLQNKFSMYIQRDSIVRY
jgi:hypothetical protein